MLSTLLSATIGVGTLCFSHLASWREFWTVWLTWWLGDMVSDIMIAPLLILLATKPLPRIDSRSAFEASLLFLVLVWIGRLVFLGKAPFSGDSYPFGISDHSAAIVGRISFPRTRRNYRLILLSGIAIWGTRHQLGPFVRTDANESMLLLQTFTGTVTMTGLVLASIVSERVRGEQRLVVQDAISRVLAEAASLKEATPRIFQALCEKARWDVGSIWDVNPANNELTCVEFWHASRPKLPPFRSIDPRTKIQTWNRFARSCLEQRQTSLGSRRG